MNNRKNPNDKYSEYAKHRSDDGMVLRTVKKSTKTKTKISKEAASVYQTKYVPITTNAKDLKNRKMNKSSKDRSVGNLHKNELLHEASPNYKNYLNIYTKNSSNKTEASSGQKKTSMTPHKMIRLHSESDVDSCDDLEVGTGKSILFAL